MKLQATIADATVDVELRREGERVVAFVDGRKHELIAHRSPAGSYLLISDSAVFDCRIEGPPAPGEPVDVFVGANHHSLTLIDPKRLRGTASVGAHGDEAARIVAPMPGKVVRVLAAVGQQVEAGAGIVVVEAMKMQNEMKSPKAGVVVALDFQIGSTVNGGDVLAVIE